MLLEAVFSVSFSPWILMLSSSYFRSMSPPVHTAKMTESCLWRTPSANTSGSSSRPGRAICGRFVAWWRREGIGMMDNHWCLCSVEEVLSSLNYSLKGSPYLFWSKLYLMPQRLQDFPVIPLMQLILNCRVGLWKFCELPAWPESADPPDI